MRQGSPRPPRDRGGARPAAEKVEQLLARAAYHDRAGKKATAEAIYAQLINAFPDMAEPRARLGLIHAASGRPQAAIEWVTSAARLAPAEPRYFTSLGEVYLAAGRPDAAAGAFRHALGLRGDAADAEIGLGNALRLLGRLGEAAECYRRAIAIVPQLLAAHINLGLTLLEAGEPAASIAILEQAVGIDPRSLEAQFDLGIARAAAADFAGAETAYRAALALNPRLAQAQINLGVALRQQDRLSEAISCFERGARLMPDLPAARLNLGAALIETGDVAAALTHIRRGIALGPASGDGQMLLARALARSGDSKGAMMALRRAVELSPTHVEALVELGRALHAQGDPAGAETMLTRALDLDPREVDALSLMSLVLQQLGKIDAAARLLDYDTGLRTRCLPEISGWNSTQDFNADLERAILRHPSLQPTHPANPIKHGSRTLRILDDPDPAIVALRREIDAAVGDYLSANLARMQSGYGANRPTAWQLRGWGNVLDTGGYQEAHVHPEGIVSGVYYVRVPRVIGAVENGEAGFIRFDHPMVPGERRATALARSIRPEAGRIVLFPSYYWHYTVPFDSPETRISIAFDIVPG